jgi:hypothetical protein
VEAAIQKRADRNQSGSPVVSVVVKEEEGYLLDSTNPKM